MNIRRRGGTTSTVHKWGRAVADGVLENYAVRGLASRAISPMNANAGNGTNGELRQTGETRPLELPPEEVIFGCSSVMAAVRQRASKVAGATVPVLIEGESGTGKEILAKFIHNRSLLQTGPFVKVSCAAIPGTLLESELFGYQKGAFSGAYTTKPGRVEMADRGTLFLDEVAELDSSLQAKLLQVLQDGQFCRIGGQGDRKIEARVICATNRNIEQEIAAGRFRQDLFYRINVIHMLMPRLRDRREDIPVLMGYLLAEFNRRFGRATVAPARATMRLLQEYDWPGNIRELENWIARYVLLGTEEAPIAAPFERSSFSVPLEVSPDGSIPLKRLTKEAALEVERTVILKVLQANRWNRRRTAEVLKISYRALIYKIRQAGLPSKGGRKRVARPAPLATESAGRD